jgi:hypothetical protein
MSLPGSAQKLLLAAALTVVITVPALAVNQGWWFRSTGAPKPQSDVSVIRLVDQPALTGR